MSDSVVDLFWDSNVLARFLTEVPPDYLPDINQYILNSRAKKCRIWISTLLYAEVRPSQLKQKNYDNVLDLINALEGSCIPIGPTPPILLRAARLRDYSYRSASPQKGEKTRVLTVPDLIHLATCLHVKEARKRQDIVFHTFDDGKGRNYEEKAVSLLRYHEYATHLQDDLDVVAVCNLTRQRPQHPLPSLDLPYPPDKAA